MPYEDLEIQQLGVGASVNGIYRGQKALRVPALNDQPEVFVARVFLETGGGPIAVQVDEHAIAQIETLEVVDGDRIIVTRSAEDRYLVAKEGPPPER
jgi:hypothetical protein